MGKSFIQIPSHYDVRWAKVMHLSGVNEMQIQLICTMHPKPPEIIRVAADFMGVDEILRLIEEHERISH